MNAITGFVERSAKVFGNLPYLPRVLSPLGEEQPYSELNPESYASPARFASVVQGAIFPIYAPFRGVNLPTVKPKAHCIKDNQKWFFLNGICTNEDVLKLNGKALAELFAREITLLHNPSDGFVLDLIECAIGRKMQIISRLDEGIAEILEKALAEHSKVVLIAHSQGGIISANAARILADKLNAEERMNELKKLELYTFASAAPELDIPEIYSEHFFNTDDYVARIGVAGFPEKFSGKLFEFEASGHLLNAHYLPHFVNKKYKCKARAQSRLFKYLQTRH